VNEIADFLFAALLAARTELAETFDDLAVLEMHANDFVIIPAPFDGAPVHDMIGGSAERIAHIRLLEDFFLASARAAIS